MTCLENAEFILTSPARGRMIRKKLARIRALFLTKTQTNLVYLFYLAGLRKAKKKRVRKYMNNVCSNINYKGLVLPYLIKTSQV